MRLDIDADGTGTLTLEGELTIQYIAELRAKLLDSMVEVRAMVVDMEKVTAVDMSCLQLLCSAHRTYFRDGKELSFRCGLPDDVKRVVQTAGYSAHVCGAGDAVRSCLWNGGKG